MKTIWVTTIWVTKKDIRRGMPRRSGCCPIALSFNRRFPGGKISVLNQIAYVGDKSISLPENARQFVRDFDCGRSVKPFHFSVNV